MARGYGSVMRDRFFGASFFEGWLAGYYTVPRLRRELQPSYQGMSSYQGM